MTATWILFFFFKRDSHFRKERLKAKVRQTGILGDLQPQPGESIPLLWLGAQSRSSEKLNVFTLWVIFSWHPGKVRQLGHAESSRARRDVVMPRAFAETFHILRMACRTAVQYYPSEQIAFLTRLLVMDSMVE